MRGGLTGYIHRHRVGLSSLVVLVIAAAVVLVYAVSSHGNPSREAHLHDSGVWVSTNQTTGADGTAASFGEMNVPAEHLAAVLTPSGAGTSVDVLQEGNAAAGLDLQAATLTPIDPVTQALNADDAIELGSGTPLIGGDDRSGTLAVLDSASGSLWATKVEADQPLAGIAAVDPSGKPMVKVGAKSAAAVGTDGTIHAASLATGITALSQDKTGKWTPTVTKLPSGLTGTVQITSVGTDPVVLVAPEAATSPSLVLPDGTVKRLDGAGNAGDVRLQQPGPAADDVIVGTPGALLAVSLKTGDVRTLFNGGSGTPAQPVFFQGCAFGAWAGGVPNEAAACGSDLKHVIAKDLPSAKGTVQRDLVFRSNHDQLLLNDRATGEVWDDLGSSPRQIADWQAASAPKQTSTTNNDTNAGEDLTRAPVANDDNLGARPGRVTALHVLDNDKTPSGTVLTVNSVSGWGSSTGSVQIAPDKQSVLVQLPTSASGAYTFSYDVTNGQKKSEKAARVSVTAVAPDVFAAPRLRTGFTPRTWTVPVNGVLTVPALNDWRVYETGDPPALGALTADATKAPGASAISTSDGSIVYSAGNTAGDDTVTYTVVDGDQTTTATLNVTVEARTSRPAAPTAQNDFVHLVVGQPMPVYPLNNDLPGSDPIDPTARLKVAGVIKGKSGLTVAPPDADGTVVLTATHPGDFTLTYSDGYGSAPVSKPASIRVQAEAADAHAAVAAEPDSVTVRGQAPALIDPTLNDASPSGGLLTVVGIDVPDAANLQAAVVRSKWLRVNQIEPVDTPIAETLTYTVTDGKTTASGELIVTELPALENDVPVTVTDYATVRAGDQVAASVLDNDIDPSGDALTLVKNVDGAPAPGQLPVEGDPGQQLGGAYVSGNQVRYDAPVVSTALSSPQQVIVTYTAQNSQGQKVPGTLNVTVVPALAPADVKADQPPVPPNLEARVVAGGSVVIHVPTSGVDPDGDSVQVQGLALPQDGDPQPRFGAVIGTTANSLTYQAYPSATNAGTDTFVYQVTDTYGITSRATIRVAVVQPTVLPAPVAHNFTLTAAPKTQLRVHVVSPAYVDYPDGAPPRLVDPNKTVPDGRSIGSLDRKNAGWLILHIPAGKTGDTVTTLYEVEPDLGAPAKGEITIHLDATYKAPPVIVDEFAKPAPKATEAKVDLLAGDYSPTGGSLTVVPQRGVTGRTLTVALTAMPQVIPFVVKDSNGATATAVAYIPAAGVNSVPYWNGRVIEMPEAKATTEQIADYVVDPQGAELQLTDRQKIWSSPTPGLSSKITGTGTMELTGADGYQGPASVTFAVTRTGELNAYTLITVPVIIGHPTPVLRCPTDIVDVEQGLVDGAAISPASQCHVWTPPSIRPASLRFHLAWKKDPGKVAIQTNDAARDVLFADHDSKPGSLGTLTVTIDGYDSVPAQLNVRIVPAPPMRVTPISVKGILTTGQPTVIDLSGYVTSPFGFNAVSIVRLGTIPDVRIVKSATGTLTISTANRELHGVRKLGYTVTDLSDPNDSSRWKTGNITLQFIGVPGMPTAVTPRPGFRSKQVPVSWVAPPSNGAPIDSYEVSYSGSGSGRQTCAAGRACVIGNLTNGGNYRFSVRAHNLAGWGVPSTLSSVGTPDAIPGVVAGFKAGNPQDHTLTLNWTPVGGEASSVDFSYTLTWSGGVSGAVVLKNRGASTYKVTGLDNDAVETFKIVAANRAGAQRVASTTTGQSAGKPAAPSFTADSFTPTKTAAGKAAVVVSWQPVTDPNGPGTGANNAVSYTLVRTNDGGGSAVTVCKGTLDTQCTDSGLNTNGQFYNYVVTAANKVFTSGSSKSARVEVSTPPEQMGQPTVDPVQPSDPDDTVTLHFTTVPSNGKSLTVHCAYTTDGSTPSTGSRACPGSPWSGYATGGGTSSAKRLSGFSSGSVPVRFVVWEDNGSTQNNRYREGPASDPSAAVTTNAPPKVSMSNCSTSGTTATCGYTANASGSRSIASRNCSASPGSCSVGANNVTISGLPENGASHTVTLTVTDNGGDRATASASYTDPPPLTVSISGCSTNNSTDTAKCSYSVSGGTGSYPTKTCSSQSGTCNVGASQVTISGLPENGNNNRTVTLTVQDSSGASKSGSATYDNPPKPAPPANPTITISKGPVDNANGCSASGNCYDVTIHYSSDFPDGTFATDISSSTAACGTSTETQQIKSNPGGTANSKYGYRHYGAGCVVDVTVHYGSGTASDSVKF